MHPYEALAGRHFWSTAVAQKNMFDIEGLWDPKFRIGRNVRVSTYGSCFAQHIGRALRARGFKWLITERTPGGMSEATAREFNYGVFSARTGNIYTASLLKQWVSWAAGDAEPPAEIWERDGRFFDPFRPNIEPDGFASPEELRGSRDMALEAFRNSILKAGVFVFTLGLTESWFNKEHGYEYPTCPGTIAGDFDGQVHQFVNQDYPTIRQSLTDAICRMQALNPSLKVLLTVSPVPLTATMSGNHVLVATMESKSVLRAVAGSLKDQYPSVDYFPSYEIINGTPFRATFFEPNQRSVSHTGVNHVMNTFFQCLTARFPEVSAPRPTSAARAGGGEELPLQPPRQRRGKAQARRPDEVVCEEELLNAFSG